MGVEQAQPVPIPGDAPSLEGYSSSAGVFLPPRTDAPTSNMDMVSRMGPGAGGSADMGAVPPAKQPSTLKKILLGVFDTIATSQGFPNHYDYQRREQAAQMAQQRINIEALNAQTQAGLREETAKFRRIQEQQNTPAPLEANDPLVAMGFPAGTMMTPAAKQAAIVELIRAKVTSGLTTEREVARINMKGKPSVGDVEGAVGNVFKQAGFNPAKMTGAQRAGLAFAKQQALETNSIKPVEDFMSKVMSAEASRSNMVIRMEGLAQMRQNSVLDTKYGNRPVMVSSEELNRAAVEEPGRYLTGSVGASALNKQALASDIHGAIARAKTSLMKLDKDFSPEFRSKMAFASRTPDPYAAMNALVNSQAAAELTPAQQDYLINHLQVIENMMAMRSVLGAGQGSDELRAAIRQTVTNAPSRQFAAKQYDTADATVSRLERGIPQVPLRPEGGAAPQSSPGANKHSDIGFVPK